MSLMNNRKCNGIFGGLWQMLWLCALLSGGGPEGRCEVLTFSLDPLRSRVEMSGTINAFGLNLAIKEQASGSLVAPFKGMVLAEVSDAAIGFTGASRIAPLETRSWEPGPYGVPGFAPASYGALVSVNLGSLEVLGKAACRGWAFNVLSTNLLLTNGTFLSRRVGLPFFDSTNSVVDYHFVIKSSGGGDPDFAPKPKASSTPVTTTVAGRHVLSSGGLTNRATNAASVAMQNGVSTLSIPIDAVCAFTATNGHNRFRFFLVFSGQLVGTLGSFVDWVPPSTPGGPLKLSWPSGYKLQRATQFWPPDWADFSEQSPLETQPSGRAYYFRAVRASE